MTFTNNSFGDILKQTKKVKQYNNEQITTKKVKQTPHKQIVKNNSPYQLDIQSVKNAISKINEKRKSNFNRNITASNVNQSCDIIMDEPQIDNCSSPFISVSVNRPSTDIPRITLTNKTTIENDNYSWDMFMNDLDNADIPETDKCDDQDNAVLKYVADDTGSIIDMSLEQKVNFEIKSSETECYMCGGKLCRKRDIVICQGCGIELRNNINMTEEQYSTSAMTECNVNANGFIPIKMIGRGAYGYQRSLYKTCASYKKYRKLNTLKDMNNWNIHSKKHHIPKNVIKEANDKFAIIKEAGYVFRKDGKKGVLSALLYYACYENGITKTPSEVASFSGIEEKFHSLGDRILCDLNERGIIDIPYKVRPIENYVDRYMELLNIPRIYEGKNYRGFVLDIIDRAEKNHIHILHDSKNNTKCVGAIYMLIDREPKLKERISKELIDKECGISKTTFIRYYNVLCKFYRKFKKSFKRYGISMKPEWKEAKK